MASGRVDNMIRELTGSTSIITCTSDHRMLKERAMKEKEVREKQVQELVVTSRGTEASELQAVEERTGSHVDTGGRDSQVGGKAESERKGNVISSNTT